MAQTKVYFDRDLARVDHGTYSAHPQVSAFRVRGEWLTPAQAAAVCSADPDAFRCDMLRLGDDPIESYCGVTGYRYRGTRYVQVGIGANYRTGTVVLETRI